MLTLAESFPQDQSFPNTFVEVCVMAIFKYDAAILTLAKHIKRYQQQCFDYD